jgi:hypothetical protein
LSGEYQDADKPASPPFIVQVQALKRQKAPVIGITSLSATFSTPVRLIHGSGKDTYEDSAPSARRVA